MSLKNKILAICPLLSVVLFLVLGFADDFGFSDRPLWHPGWVVFLLTPLVSTVLNMKKLRVSVGMVITILYIVIGTIFDLWHPGWIMFLFIPIFEILLTPSKKNKKVRWSYINVNKESNKYEDSEESNE